jgi:DNA-binding MarR family transcriptional regulator
VKSSLLCVSVVKITLGVWETPFNRQTEKSDLPVCLYLCSNGIVTTRKSFEHDVTELAQAVGLLVRRMRAAAASHELSLTELAGLARLDRSGPATTADLARAEGMKPQSMGATIAALDERGLIERRPHPTDGRQVNIMLTAKGAEVRKSARDAKRTWLAQAVVQLDRGEQDTLFAAGRIIRRVAEL